ncbi:DUF5067 domain-containing protein [Fructilactobacillus vespulae]|uniref:DUF5067 domain-containing protein n=1 Tax=Fructilactobacillus vespulae TaxID=1249630 RepID=UPI0039B59A80
MKKFLIGTLTIASCLTLASCSSLDGSYKKSNQDNTKKTKQIKAPAKSSFKNNVAKLNDKTIKIKGVKTIQQGDSDQTLIAFQYKVTNESTNILTPLNAWNSTFKVSQGNKELKTTDFSDDRLPSNPNENLAKGDSIESSVVYALDNANDSIKINASEGISNNNITAATTSTLDGTNLGTEEFSIKQ